MFSSNKGLGKAEEASTRRSGGGAASVFASRRVATGRRGNVTARREMKHTLESVLGGPTFFILPSWNTKLLERGLFFTCQIN
jgi:hypothetical protein